MGFNDRRYEQQDGGGGGGFRRAMRRIFIEGDGFLSWALPLFRFRGILVRIHILYIVFVLADLAMAARRDTTGLEMKAFQIATLFLLVLLHEFGHCFACRRVGGEADDILMWPLGGLAACHPPRRWQAHLITVLAGPGVNAALIPVFGGVLLALGADWGLLVFNPFDPKPWASPWFSYPVAHWQSMLWAAYYMNLVLLLFNVLLPMYPMDGGRIVQCVLWSRIGLRRSLWISANIGLVLAIAVGVFAATTGANILFTVALFAGFTCYSERQRAAMMADEPDYDTGRPAEFGYGPRMTEERGGVVGGGGATATRAAPQTDRAFDAAAARQKQQQAEQAEVDKILAKIAATGMGSLSRGERKTLERATARRRGGKDGVD